MLIGRGQGFPHHLKRSDLMPTVAGARDDLFEALGQTMTDDEFDELCFAFGIELDEITSEQQMARKERGDEAAKGQSDRVIYKIDVPANRYDLLCLEGLARSLNIFLEKAQPPVYNVIPGADPKNTFHVKTATKEIRPFVVSAILRGITFNHTSYNSFLDLQDKLHQNICRRRTLVAIGTHDLDTLTGPFTYDARAPSDIRFVPLFQTREFSAGELVEFYQTDPGSKHLKPYTPIIAASPVYPVITDAAGVVLSLPPLINGAHSALSVGSRNILIECTATDLTKAHIVLNTMVTMFAQLCATPFTIESVPVTYEDATVCGGYVSPDLSCREVAVSLPRTCSLIGVPLPGERVVQLASKMQLAPARLSEDGSEYIVTVPPTRSDILHPVDVMEDIAIAHGFNNIPLAIPPSYAAGGPQPINHMTDLLRESIAAAGYTEVLTHGLASRKEEYEALRLEDDGRAVGLANPVTAEFEVVRTRLLPGLLKTLGANRSASLRDGLKLFEISDVVLKEAGSDVGAVNVRRLAALYTGPSAGFELIHGLLDRVMQLMAVAPSAEYAENSLKGGSAGGLGTVEAAVRYTVEPSSVPTYFPGRSANVILLKGDGSRVQLGHFGVLHPSVLAAFELSYPCSALEIDLQPLL